MPARCTAESAEHDKSQFATDERLSCAYAGSRALVVGGGFLGKNLAIALTALGCKVSLFSRSVASPLQGVTHLVGDAADERAVQQAVDGVQFVFDCTGGMNATESNRRPVRAIEKLLTPSLTIAQVCAEALNRPVFLTLSTRLVYGAPRTLPVDESHPLDPSSVYASCKLMAEHAVRALGRAQAEDAGLRWIVARVANPYGPHFAADQPCSCVINEFIRKSLLGRTIELYGQGDVLRDYVYVDDLVAMLLQMAATPACQGEIFNVGGPAPISIADAARSIAKLAGAPAPKAVPAPSEQNAVETGDYHTDMRKLGQCIEIPAMRSFEDGVARTIALMRPLVCSTTEKAPL